MRDVLLVDGHEDTRHVLSAVLAHGGYDVRQAADGIDAMEAVRESRPDLVAMEHPAYLRGGVELVSLLRSAPDVPRTPILVVTSRTFGTDEDWPGREEHDRLLTKPVIPSRFLETVRTMIGPPQGEWPPRPPQPTVPAP